MKFASTIFGCLCLFVTQAQPLFLNWAKQLGASGYDGVMGVKSDSDGNLFLTGHFTGTVDFDTGPGVYSLNGTGPRNTFICKYDPPGTIVWAKALNGDEETFSMDITLDPSGNVLATGFFRGTVDFDPGMAVFNMTAAGDLCESFACKLDPSGNLLWAKKFGSANGYGSTSVKTDADGNVVMTGIFEGTADFDPGAGTFIMNVQSQAFENAFILKLNASGDFVWAKQIKVTSAYAQGVVVDVDQAGNVYASGDFTSTADLDPGPASLNVTSAGGLDTYVLKLNPSGDLIWAKRYGGPEPDQVTTIDVSSSGNVYLSGMYASGGVDFDPGTGFYTLPYHWSNDCYVMKLDPNGDFTWCKGFGNDDYDATNALVLDSDEHLYLTGRFRLDVDFDPGAGTFILSSAGAGTDDGFILSLDPNGDFAWAGQLHGNTNVCTSVDLAPQNGLYIGGIFANPTDFDPSAGSYMMYTPSGYPDGFFMRMSYGPGAAVAEQTGNPGIHVFPNPFTSELNIETDQLPVAATVSIVNSLGEIVFVRKNVSDQHITLPVEDLPAGIYTVILHDAGRTGGMKIVK